MNFRIEYLEPPYKVVTCHCKNCEFVEILSDINKNFKIVIDSSHYFPNFGEIVSSIGKCQVVHVYNYSRPNSPRAKLHLENISVSTLILESLQEINIDTLPLLFVDKLHIMSKCTGTNYPNVNTIVFGDDANLTWQGKIPPKLSWLKLWGDRYVTDQKTMDVLKKKMSFSSFQKLYIS